MAEPTLEVLTERFSKLGFSEKTIKETLKNKKVTNSLLHVLEEVDIGDAPPSDFDKHQAALLATLSTLAKDGDLDNRAYIAKAIRDDRLKTNLQVEGKYRDLHFVV
jgi:glutaminyl-tRNA synthetase